MQLTGEEFFTESKADLWSRLVDFEFVGKVLPGLEQIDRIEEDSMVCRVRPDLPLPLGTVKLTLHRERAEPCDSAVMRVIGKAVGSSATVETLIELQDADGRTRVGWTADITEITGLLKIARQDRFEAVVRLIIDEVCANVRNELAASG